MAAGFLYLLRSKDEQTTLTEEKKRINLPLLESIKSDIFSLKRVGEKDFNERVVGGFPEKGFSQRVKDLRGLLWMDERNEEYTVA
ncbi:hypothetical protein YC2023_045060 [Brassica napus]